MSKKIYNNLLTLFFFCSDWPLIILSSLKKIQCMNDYKILNSILNKSYCYYDVFEDNYLEKEIYTILLFDKKKTNCKINDELNIFLQRSKNNNKLNVKLK